MIGTVTSIIISILFGVLGVLGTYYTIKYTKIKRPLWLCSINYLFHSGIELIDGLRIKYKEQSVENLSSVLFAFWNNGNGVIKCEDIAEPILFSVKDKFTIYHAEVIKPKSEKNYNKFEIVLAPNKKSFEIKFKYLDKNQGGLIQIYSDIKKIEDYDVKGRIVESKEFNKKNFSKNKKHLFIPILFLVFGIIALTSFILCLNNLIGLDFFILIVSIYPFVVLGLIMIVNLLLKKLNISFGRIYNQLPKEIKEYFSQK